jgi:hypothetical protein
MNEKELDTLDFIENNTGFYYQEDELSLEEWEAINAILEE